MDQEYLDSLFGVLSRIECKIDSLDDRLAKIEGSNTKIESNLEEIVDEQVRLTDYCEVSENQVKFFQTAYENVREPLDFVFTQLNTFKETFKFLSSNQIVGRVLPSVPVASYESFITPVGAARRGLTQET